MHPSNVRSLLAGACASLQALVCVAAVLPAQERSASGRVRYEVHSGYSVSNQFEPGSSSSFLVIENEKQFNTVFGVAAIMGDKSDRLQPGAFQSRVVIAVIKRGNYVWDYHVDEIEDIQGVLYLHYTLTFEDGGLSSFSSPLIVSVERQKYTGVVFVENGKTVKRIKVKL